MQRMARCVSCLRMIHDLPPTPAFRNEPADSPIAEIALRITVEFPGGETHVVGTATLVAGHLAITAKHVIDHVLDEFGANKTAANSAVVRNYMVRLYQVMKGPVYRVWKFTTCGVLLRRILLSCTLGSLRHQTHTALSTGGCRGYDACRRR